MAEYIEREHLAELLKEDIDLCGEKNSSTKPISYGTALGLEMALRYVYAVGAADVVEVVRCKDCNQWKRNSGFVDSPNGHCFYHSIDTNGHDFCSYGVAKMDGKGEGE